MVNPDIFPCPFMTITGIIALAAPVHMFLACPFGASGCSCPEYGKSVSKARAYFSILEVMLSEIRTTTYLVTKSGAIQ